MPHSFILCKHKPTAQSTAAMYTKRQSKLVLSNAAVWTASGAPHTLEAFQAGAQQTHQAAINCCHQGPSAFRQQALPCAHFAQPHTIHPTGHLHVLALLTHGQRWACLRGQGIRCMRRTGQSRVLRRWQWGLRPGQARWWWRRCQRMT